MARWTSHFTAGSAGNAMVAGIAVIDLDAVEGVIFADGFESGDPGSVGLKSDQPSASAIAQPMTTMKN